VQYLPGALCVSTSALMTDDGENYYLMVVDPETREAMPVTVTVLAEGSTTAAIEGAVAEGDEVQSGLSMPTAEGAEYETGGAVIF